MKNNILIDAERTRYLSGISIVCRNLIKGLYSFLPITNLNFIVYADEKKFPSDSGYKFKAWKFWHKIFHKDLKKISIVHIFNQSNVYFPSKFKAKKIVTLHDLNFLHENLPDKKVNKNIQKAKKNLKDADCVVCISNFVKKDFLENKKLFEIEKEQTIEVIYNGLDFPDAHITYNLDKFSFLVGKKYFLNIGVLFPKKNQIAIVKMLSLVQEDLVLVVSESKKNYESEILEFVSINNLKNRVHILRNISDEEKYALIQNCEALLHPSLAEGFGIPPIEAMYFGKPVFLSKYTSLPEIGGNYAFYFDDFDPENMAETLKKGLEQYKTRPEMKKMIRDWALQYDYKVMAKQYLELYEKILD